MLLKEESEQPGVRCGDRQESSLTQGMQERESKSALRKESKREMINCDVKEIEVVVLVSDEEGATVSTLCH